MSSDEQAKCVVEVVTTNHRRKAGFLRSAKVQSLEDLASKNEAREAALLSKLQNPVPLLWNMFLEGSSSVEVVFGAPG